MKVAIVGLGNCASSLIQGIYQFKDSPESFCGLTHLSIGNRTPGDIEIVCAFDVDARKVGLPLGKAIWAYPNNTAVFFPRVENDAPVFMGQVLDGIAAHHVLYPQDSSFRQADHPEPSLDEVVDKLKSLEVDVLINYLPVGSKKATAFYAEAALEARVGFVNCIPVFIASDREWADRFTARGIPIVGDDIKAQVGATILHRTLVELLESRGATVDGTYQLNVGGNTDFLNMLDRNRLGDKKVSKTEAVQSLLKERLPNEKIHVGPSDYVPWLKDNKVCFMRLEGRLFGGVPMNIELRLSVEDSPNSAGCCINALRVCMMALERGIGGPLHPACSLYMKHPPVQVPDKQAAIEFDHLIRELSDSSVVKD